MALSLGGLRAVHACWDDLPEGVTIGGDGHTLTNVRIANWRQGAKAIAEIALVPAGEHVLEHLDMRC